MLVSGINVEESPEGKRRLSGDVNFEEAKSVAGHLTPVPGGVGPMTVAMLLRNTFHQAVARKLNVGWMAMRGRHFLIRRI